MLSPGSRLEKSVKKWYCICVKQVDNGVHKPALAFYTGYSTTYSQPVTVCALVIPRPEAVTGAVLCSQMS